MTIFVHGKLLSKPNVKPTFFHGIELYSPAYPKTFSTPTTLAFLPISQAFKHLKLMFIA